MTDRVALVTGASRGIGRAVAVALAQRGFDVGINYSSSADEAKETLRLVEEAGSGGVCVQADVGDAGAVDALFNEVESSLGQIAALVNNAGVRADGLALAMKDDAWERVLRTNLYGTFACCRRALRPMLKARSGRIVNIASVAGLHGSPGQANYAAAKAGVIGLTKTLAREIASKGITVNAIAPGLIETDLTTSLKERQWDALTSEVPAGRAGTPEEVGRLAAYLCSDDAEYITGSVFVIDGGMTA
ncbi:MAG: 3-oxoacyl-[acyl-carrier-protein] reductase [Actinomycetota bacterium]